MILATASAVGSTWATIWLNPFTGESDNFDLMHSWIPELDIYEASMATKDAPGVGTDYKLAAFNAAQTGNTITLSHPATSVSGSVAGKWLESTGTALTDGRDVHLTNTGVPVYQPAMMAMTYQNNTIDTGLGIHVGGKSETNWGPTTTWKYLSIGKVGAATTTEANVRVIWPTTGKFQYLKMLYKNACSVLPHSILWRLRIDGVDSAMSYEIPSELTTAAHLFDDTTTEVAVTAGQVVTVGIQRSSGTGVASFACVFSVGYLST